MPADFTSRAGSNFWLGQTLHFGVKYFGNGKNPSVFFVCFWRKGAGRAPPSQHPPIPFWDLPNPGDWEARPREITRKAGIL